MDIKQITNSLNDIFNKEKHRIVFWYDPENEFNEILPDLDLPDVTILRKDEIGTLELKIKLEIEDTKGRYIVYSPTTEPSTETDWLLDIKLYSRTFNADRASMILNELNLSNHSLRAYIGKHKKFFANQDRVNKLDRWTTSEDMEADLDLKMLGVLTKADEPAVFSILFNLFAAYCNDGLFNPDKSPKMWEELDKFGLKSSFWTLIEKTFGYVNDNPTLSDLAIRLFVTDFVKNLEANMPQGIEQFIISKSSGAQNASVFLSQWRNNRVHFENYNIISKDTDEKLKVADKLQNLSIEQLIEITTFESIERKIISIIRDMILDAKEDTYDEIKEYIQSRRDVYWTSTIFGDNKNNLYKITYEALGTVIDLFRLRSKYADGLRYPAADSMFDAYTQELFRFDQYYRQFQQAADTVEKGQFDILKTLKSVVEDCYSGWYLEQMAISWDGLIEQSKNGGLLQKWNLSEIKNQHMFYKEYVSDFLLLSPRGRVFVIISDAFRYEAAEELTSNLNGKNRFKANLEPMLGVVPSYTALGMAALLPHKGITYKDNSSKEILVNGRPTDSLNKRSDILAESNGIAIKADDLLHMKKDEGREFVKPHKVIYIYHNLIDSAGDKEATESNVFNAVNESIGQLDALVSFIINSLNGNYVLITADHGFIYYERSPKPIDKSTLGNKPSKAVEAKKRFIIGEKLGKSKKVLYGNTKSTAQTEPGMEFWLPRGINRFHFVGGARYFHGGAMLQEVVVPVIKIKEARGKEVAKTKTAEVGVSLLGSSRKIVTNIHRFEFIQTDPVSERVKPKILIFALRDGNDLISNEETVTFDSSSSSMEERKKSVKLMLKAYQYDSKKEYFLVLREADTDIEYDRIPINIDLAFTNDF